MGKVNSVIIRRQIYLYAVIFLGLSMTNTQIIPFLTYVGYNPVERGMILSSIAIVAILGQIITGYLCDKYSTIKKFYHGLLFLFILLNGILYFVSEEVFFVHLILFGFVGGLFRIIAGLVETWTLEINENVKDHFGLIRAFGALGWAIGAPLTSLLIDNFGYRVIGLSFAIVSMFSLIFSMNTPDASKVQTTQKLKISDIRVLLKNRNYVVLLGMLILVNLVFAADMYTVIDKMVFLGASSSQIAFKWSFQAILELPLFFLGFVLLNKVGAKKMLIFSIFMYIIRFSLYTIATTPFQIVMISGLQAFTFPVLMIAQKVLVAEESPMQLKSTGQMFALSMYGGLSALLTPIISGNLISLVGFDLTLLIFSVSLFIPLYLSIKYYVSTSSFT